MQNIWFFQLSATEKMAAVEKEKQKEIFYALLAVYVKNKVGEEEPSYQIWLEKGSLLVTRDWLQIISVYAVMLKCCGLSMLFFVDPVLQGDDAKHYLSYVYSRFLAPEVIGKPNEMYERCVWVMPMLLENVSTNPIFSSSIFAEGSDESPVAALVAKFEKLK